MFEGTDSGINPSELRIIQRCKIPTVITKTLIV